MIECKVCLFYVSSPYEAHVDFEKQNIFNGCGGFYFDILSYILQCPNKTKPKKNK